MYARGVSKLLVKCELASWFSHRLCMFCRGFPCSYTHISVLFPFPVRSINKLQNNSMCFALESVVTHDKIFEYAKVKKEVDKRRYALFNFPPKSITIPQNKLVCTSLIEIIESIPYRRFVSSFSLEIVIYIISCINKLYCDSILN